MAIKFLRRILIQELKRISAKHPRLKKNRKSAEEVVSGLSDNEVRQIFAEMLHRYQESNAINN